MAVKKRAGRFDRARAAHPPVREDATLAAAAVLFIAAGAFVSHLNRRTVEHELVPYRQDIANMLHHVEQADKADGGE